MKLNAKKYPFAILYIKFTSIIAILFFILGITMAFLKVRSGVSTLTEHRNSVSDITAEFGFDQISLQLLNAATALLNEQDISRFQKALSRISGINDSTLRPNKHKKHLGTLEELEELTESVKTESLNQFIENMSILQKSASKSETSSFADASSRITDNTSSFETSRSSIYSETKSSYEINEFLNEYWPSYDNFLRNDIKYFSANSDVYRFSNQAADGVQKHIAELKKIITPEPTSTNDNTNRGNRVEDSDPDSIQNRKKLAANLDLIYNNTIDLLSSEWVVEENLEYLRQELNGWQNDSKIAKEEAWADFESSIYTLLGSLGVALALFVIRDFMAAHIHNAENTLNIANALAGTNIEYE